MNDTMTFCGLVNTGRKNALQAFDQLPNFPSFQNSETHFPYSLGLPRGYCSSSDK